jgi:tetratricopeptide (TPR) repeat protein
LGSVAQGLREFDQARNDYQQALQIDIEFDDRYSQASTYSQLGLLAETLDEPEEAIANHLQDLTISMEIKINADSYLFWVISIVFINPIPHPNSCRKLPRFWVSVMQRFCSCLNQRLWPRPWRKPPTPNSGGDRLGIEN